jgi:hypothetical protein
MSATVSPKDYYHRRNKDGGFDTVCVYCSTLVGIGESESALIHFESWHRCTPKAHAKTAAQATLSSPRLEESTLSWIEEGCRPFTRTGS